MIKTEKFNNIMKKAIEMINKLNSLEIKLTKKEEKVKPMRAQ